MIIKSARDGVVQGPVGGEVRPAREGGVLEGPLAGFALDVVNKEAARAVLRDRKEDV